MGPLRRRGRLPGLEHDHERGHQRYVSALDAWSRSYLETKPFRAPPNHELTYCLRGFAHLLDELDLEPRAQVLDAGCGPGWLTELLARCGYWVTGVDVSPAMIEVARRRLEAIPRSIGPGRGSIPWRGRFDAVVLYDALHHLEDELATLTRLRDALVPGGRIFIHEAARPRRGSAEERAFLEEMRRHGTLESPFDPRYLVRVLRDAGFVQIRRLAPIDRLLRAGRPWAAARHLLGRSLRPQTNTIVAVAPGGDGRPDFRGRIELVDVARREDEVTLRVRVTNVGRRYWPAADAHPFAVGSVTLAPYASTPAGRRELSRATLPSSLAPDGSVVRAVTVAAPLPDAPLAVDLVREGIAWFQDLGGEPLLLGRTQAA
jgi:SAM-dependent methyltransferase